MLVVGGAAVALLSVQKAGLRNPAILRHVHVIVAVV